MVFIEKAIGITAILSFLSTQVLAASIPSNAVAQYWGQNSALDQQNLAHYCDGSSDVFLVSFLTDFNVGGLPNLNFANACTDVFSGTTLLNCPQIGADIKTCQSKGKKVLLSLGGAAGSYGFTSDAQATTFANTLYGMFGKGTHQYRPFGDAVIDGFDLDIEGGGPTGYATLINSLRSLDANVLITGAPQCPYPDAMLGDAMNKASFDAVWVQFYNNYCSVTGGNFNFDAWNTWATQTSTNKNVKVFLGLPGSSSAAGSGYVGYSQIQSTVNSLHQYSSFGGVMFWDASQSYSNTEVSPDLAAAVGTFVHGGSSGGGSTSTTTTSAKPTTTATPTTTSASSSAVSSTTSASSTPSSSPGTCVTNGEACSTQGKYVCSGNSFAICDHGAWVLQGCGSGLTCFPTTDGASVYCAQPSSGSGSTCTNANAVPAAPKAYKSALVQAQLSVANATETSWSAVVNARRLKTLPFGSKVVVHFKLPSHMTIDSVSNGRVIQNGTLASVQITNPHKKSMDLLFTLNGSVEKGTVFVAPTSSNIKFQS
ncbi:glycoside hydrolase [Hesseltinella vesiculosa]|uniref:chitinase n=1 Tax=Hesseltinella vesiculosa TaxID=101127 RepID=A0A1X2GII3_9FUNG|nr:glycoside hydrolase [Hesseltinella vesiculosa]